ncbi:unnamed protein product [Protopolystoma xenopodis]|uniref:Uncharacterized protein n=1 Tax=Protopolystoma xenopodis TaxID=117903 RepID=A0A448X7N4_9PLAT|nr:unnamed protein product [Protopolystoma xenopodis]
MFHFKSHQVVKSQPIENLEALRLVPTTASLQAVTALERCKDPVAQVAPEFCHSASERLEPVKGSTLPQTDISQRLFERYSFHGFRRFLMPKKGYQKKQTWSFRKKVGEHQSDSELYSLEMMQAKKGVILDSQEVDTEAGESNASKEVKTSAKGLNSSKTVMETKYRKALHHLRHPFSRSCDSAKLDEIMYTGM